ncbi:MAG: hypothetical protein A2X84_07705 [Desulfuromonadaceae bacterium GWC2_58_13]|nr:MAG: hypothetical protein A2X84_07705 [Desulfuromonadaceae bacterium GWC2_58_13]
MQRWFLASVLLLMITGCGGGSFTVPKDQYREQVQTLGVLPLMLDEASDIDHPERDAVAEMLRRYNAATQGLLIETLKESKNYFDVRVVPGDAREMFNRLVTGRNLNGSGDEQHRGYVLNGTEIASLAEKNVVDALLVLIFNGLERQETRWDRTKLTYLKARYNVILVGAMVITPDGRVLWEYHGEPGESFLPLQYPDFDEAFYNKTEEVKIRFISIPGLERTLAERETAFLGSGSWPRLYKELFEGLASELSPGMINPLRNKEQ